jgi:hypothetical protein
MSITTPSADNLYVGAGDVWFDRFDSAGLSTGFRHLGNVSSLEGTPALESIKKRSSMSGLGGTLKELIRSTDFAISAVMDEYDPANMALALLGSSLDVTQTSEPTVTTQAINDGNALLFDVWYPLYTTTHPDGLIDVTVTSVDQAGALTPGTDYEIDTEVGMIRILSTGGGAEAVTTWSGSVPAIVAADGLKLIHGLSAPTIEGRLRFRSASDQTTGPRVLIDFWKVKIQPDSAIPLITEDFGEYTLNMAVQEDLSRSAGERFFRMIRLGNSGEVLSF